MKTAEYLQRLFMNEVFRVYTSPDMLGMELGGSLKNVIALAAGIADGLGYGDNAKASTDHQRNCMRSQDWVLRWVELLKALPVLPELAI